ncbi:MAG: clostripain-related cysteine peptidase, partial [bacterium]|nr:clostripain-related cysteine peptidase [bacterium]
DYSPGAFGLAVYFPREEYEFDPDYNCGIIDLPCDTNWDEFLAWFTTPPFSELRVRAYIDGRSHLLIQGNEVWWHHYDNAAPGRLGGANEPTILNSAEWYPGWPEEGENRNCDCDSSRYSDLYPPLPSDGSQITLDPIAVRGAVSIVQQPSEVNGYTAIIEFDDNPPGGADWYEIALRIIGLHTPPQVVAIWPEARATAVISTQITATFNEPVNEDTLNTSTVLVTGSINGSMMGTVLYDAATWTITFTPGSPFVEGEVVAVTITGDVQDMAGDGLDGNGNGISEGSPLDDYHWSFVTRAPETIYVDVSNETGIEDGTPEHPFSSIAEAITFASDGDTILVAEGTYDENLEINGKTLYLLGGFEPTGWNRDIKVYETIVDGGGRGPTVHIEGSTTVLEGFTIQHGQAGNHGGGGIETYGGAPEIRYCTIRNNTAIGDDEWGGGGILMGKGTPRILNCYVIENHSPQGAGGIRAGGCDILIANTIVARNTGDAGIHFNEATGLIVNSTIVGNPGGGFGFYLSSVAVLNCIEWDNNEHNWGNLDNINYSNIEEESEGTGNISEEPLFMNDSDYHLQLCSPCIDTGDPDPAYNDVDGTRNDMGAYGGPGGESYEYLDGPPEVEDVMVNPGYVAPGDVVTITAEVWDACSGVGSVQAEIESPDETVQATIELFDDGAHNDAAAGDNIYGNTWTTPLTPMSYVVDIVATDMNSNSVTRDNAAAFTTDESSLPQQLTTDTGIDGYPSITQTSDGTSWVVWTSSRGSYHLWYKRSDDGGSTWSEAQQLTFGDSYDVFPSIAQAGDGSIWVVWQRDGDVWYKTSSDNGASWSAEAQLTTDPGWEKYPDIAADATGKIILTWASWNSGNMDVYYKLSLNNGATWFGPIQLTTDPSYDEYPSVAIDGANGIHIIWHSGRSGNPDLWYVSSEDDGAHWSTPAQLTTYPSIDVYSSIDIDSSGKMWISWERWVDRRTGDFDIFYMTSDDGISWSSPTQFTRFAGWDNWPDVSIVSDQPWVVWMSDRAVNPDIWLGVLGTTQDSNPPPHVYWVTSDPYSPAPFPDDVITLRARVLDETGVQSVQAVYSVDGVAQAPLMMYDDGAHNDEASGDDIWGIEIGLYPVGTIIEFQVQAEDISGNTVLAPQEPIRIEVIGPFVPTTDLLVVFDHPWWWWPKEDREQWLQYYTDALDTNGYTYDVWDSFLRGEIDEGTLSYYTSGAVIWSTPFGGYITSDSTQSNLQSYLDAGGRLFITGQDIGWSIGVTTFYSDYLHASYVQDDPDLRNLSGVTGDPVSDGLYLSIAGEGGADNQYFPDEIDPIHPAVGIFTYEPDKKVAAPSRKGRSMELIGKKYPPSEPLMAWRADRDRFSPERMWEKDSLAQAGMAGGEKREIASSGTGALRVNTGIYKVVYFAFGFEGINSPEDRSTVMERVLSWLYEPPGTMAGIVTDSAGNPVANVEVNAFHESITPEKLAAIKADPERNTGLAAWTTTNDSGAYTIEGLVPGQYMVDAYPPTGLNLLLVHTEGVLVAGGETTTHNIVLPPGGIITGIVTNYQGNPVAGAYVGAGLDPFSKSEKEKTKGAWGETITDVEGRYTIRGLFTGTYSMWAYPPPESDLFPVFMRGISVTAGETTTQNLILGEGRKITGKVTDTVGNPIAGVEIYAFMEWKWWMGEEDLTALKTDPQTIKDKWMDGWAVTDENGDYVISDLDPGTYEMWAFPPEDSPFAWQYKTGIQVEIDTPTVVNFVLQEGGTLAGVVLDPWGNPVFDAQVLALSQKGKGPAGFASTDEQGVYVIDGLDSGSYAVEVWPPWESGLLGKEISGVNVSSGEVTLQNFILPEGGKISGRVTDESDQPVAGAEIYASLQLMSREELTAVKADPRSAKWPFGWAMTDEEGYYTISGLDSGTYFMDVYPPPGTNLLEAHIAGVSVTAGEETNVDFILLPPPAFDCEVQVQYRESSEYGLSFVAHLDMIGGVPIPHEDIISATVSGPAIADSQPLSFVPDPFVGDFWHYFQDASEVNLGKTYTFTVRYILDGSERTVSEVAAITNIVTDIPTKIFPLADEVITTSTPVFRWEPVSDPDVVFYDVAVATAPNWESKVWYGHTTDGYLPYNADGNALLGYERLGSGSYYWAIFSCDEENNHSVTDWTLFTVEISNVPPTIELTSPFDPAETADEVYTITWLDSDPDDNAGISLYWDNDDTGFDGHLIISGISEDDLTDSYTWDVSLLPNGNYYLYAAIDDGTNPFIYDYSDYPLTIQHPTSNWVFLVYLDGDNNLEDAGIDDLNEMEMVGSNSQVKIVVQFDRIYGFDTSNGNWTTTRRYLVNQDSDPNVINSTLLDDIGEANMGDPATLVDFVTWGMNTFAADHYAVVLWNHGGGWRERMKEILKSQGKKGSDRAVAWDDTSGGDCLFMSEVKGALAQIVTNQGRQIDLVGFDACLMGMVEVAYQLRDQAQVMVASEEVEPWEGWPYNTILADLAANPSMSPAELGEAIVVRYGEDYGNSNENTQSAVDVSNMAGLSGAITAFAQSLIGSPYWDELHLLRGQVEEFYYSANVDLYHFADLVSANITNPAIQSAAEALKSEINNTVVANWHGDYSPGAFGLAVYFPREEYKFDPDYNCGIIDFPCDTDWNEFLAWYLNPAPSAPCGIAIDLRPDVPGIQNTRSVHQGETLSIDIWAQNVLNLDTFDFKLRVCDSAKLEIVGAAEGPFLGLLGGTALFLSSMTDTFTIQITGSLSGNDPDSAPDGDGVIAHVSLNVVGENNGETCAISLLDPMYWDSQSNQTVPTPSGATVIIGIPGDCTGPEGNPDGCVNVWDFIQFTDSWLQCD